MYPEHELLHTRRSDDTIFSLLGHTLRLKKFFSFFYYFLSYTNCPSTQHYYEGEAWSTQQWNIASAPEITSHYLSITHWGCHTPSGDSRSSDMLPTVTACQMASRVQLVIGGHHPAQLDSSTACFSVPSVQCGYSGEFLNTQFKNAKPVWTDNSDIMQLPWCHLYLKPYYSESNKNTSLQIPK